MSRRRKIEEGDVLISTTDTRNRKKGDFLLICYVTPPLIGYQYRNNKFAEADRLVFSKETEFASTAQIILFAKGQTNINNERKSA